MRLSILPVAFLIVLCFCNTTTQHSFLQNQLSFARVKGAYIKKEALVKFMLTEKNIDTNHFDLYLRAFKQEQALEVWAKNSYHETYSLLTTIPICVLSGQAGPKRKQGDGQIPEGFYKINVFNPMSNYYLSLGLNYPNKSDSLLSRAIKLGGDIFIHGGCESIGCLPLTNDRIEDLYILSILAKAAGQLEIPVHIFPNRMNTANYKYLIDNSTDLEIKQFWGNIRTGYLAFEISGTLPKVTINSMGYYEFAKF